MCSFLSKSASTKAVIKSTFVKNTHYSGIFRRMDLWLQPVTPWRVYFPVEVQGGCLSAHKRREELIDCLGLPKRLRQLPLDRADWQPDGPIKEETSVTNMSQNQWWSSDSEVGGASFFPTVTPHCRISTMISIHRSPHRCHRNTPGHRKERRLAGKGARHMPKKNALKSGHSTMSKIIFWIKKTKLDMYKCICPHKSHKCRPN